MSSSTYPRDSIRSRCDAARNERRSSSDGTRRNRPRVAVDLVFAALCAVALTACGIPTIQFIEPPENPDFEGNEENRTLTFEHSSENDGGGFQGYELYYKLYALDSAAIASDEAFIESTPREPGPSRLQQRNFLRAVAVTVRSSADLSITSDIVGDRTRPPHLPTDPTSTSIEYSIDLRDPTQRDIGSPDRLDYPAAEVIVSWNQSGQQVRGFRRRNVDQDGPINPRDVFEGFWHASGYSSTDFDVSRMQLNLASGTPDQITVVWYVLSYGIDETDFSPFYSEPLRLESARLTLDDS